LMSVAVSLMSTMMMVLMNDNSLTPAMAIACVAYEDGLFLDAEDIDITPVSRVLSDLEGEDTLPCVRQFHLPVAALCPRRTRIDRVAVVDALADGEALDDLDAHYEYEAGMLLSLGFSLRIVDSSVVQTWCC
jgi:hypothetical protein